MSGDEKNLKDSNLNTNLALKDTSISLSYSKSNKLVTALYIVTDIINVVEPIRLRLRSLAVEIISDINLIQQNSNYSANFLLTKIQEVLSLLDIASGINLISPMNYNILKKEFIELEQSIKEYRNIGSAWLEEFLVSNPESAPEKKNFEVISFNDRNEQVKGHHQPMSKTNIKSTRLGVQKAGSLMQVLSDRALVDSVSDRPNFDNLRKQRRQEIIDIVKTNNNQGLTITDIKDKGHQIKDTALFSCGEKTLQRELISMLKDSILYKTGEKRWSKYFVKN